MSRQSAAWRWFVGTGVTMAAGVTVAAGVRGITTLRAQQRRELLAQNETLLREREALRQQCERLHGELLHHTEHDRLTGLTNRDGFRRRLTTALSTVDVAGGTALLLINLDGFREINDTLGHGTGDELLRIAADRLRAMLDNNDNDGGNGGPVVARLAGDEFAVITVDGAADKLAQRCVAVLAQPYPLTGREVRLTASIGVCDAANAGASNLTASALLQCADLALTAAKGAGRNRAVRYEQSMRAEQLAHARLAEQLREALEHDGFTLNYQPVVDLGTGGIGTVEALLRFTPPGGSPISPAMFIPVAEQTGLIGRIGAWVLERACADAVAWYQGHGVGVSVNVSGQQLADPAFADDVLATLHRTGLPGRALILEITETVLVTATGDQTEAVSRRLARLRAHGVRIAIDDFGTGYASLAYLRTLPIDILKIDRAFIIRAEEGQPSVNKDRALLRTVLDLARSLYLQPVAEGVETTRQAAALRELDCRYAQGFLFARPMPAAELDALLAQPSSTTSTMN